MIDTFRPRPKRMAGSAGWRSVFRWSALLISTAFCYGCLPKAAVKYEPIADLRSAVVRQAQALLGKPYRLGGKGPGAFDCSGLVYYVFQKVGLPLPPLTEDLLRSGSFIPGEEVLPGDLVFFKVAKDLHVGIMVTKKSFIHASSKRGVVTDNLSSAYWERNLIGFKRIL